MTTHFTLPSSAQLYTFAEHIVRIIFILLVAWIITRILNRWFPRLRAHIVKQMLAQRGGEDGELEKRANTIGGIIRRTIAVVIWIMAIMMALKDAGFDIGPILAAAGIVYAHMPALGGLRHARPDSINTGWQNASFRGFADYMQTSAFAAAIAELLAMAGQPPSPAAPMTAVMCAEAVPWRCHRSLIADAALARGVAVEHILGPGPRRPARLTPFARVDGEQVTYPALC